MAQKYKAGCGYCSELDMSHTVLQHSRNPIDGLATKACYGRQLDFVVRGGTYMLRICNNQLIPLILPYTDSCVGQSDLKTITTSSMSELITDLHSVLTTYVA